MHCECYIQIKCVFEVYECANQYLFVCFKQRWSRRQMHRLLHSYQLSPPNIKRPEGKHDCPMTRVTMPTILVPALFIFLCSWISMNLCQQGNQAPHPRSLGNCVLTLVRLFLHYFESLTVLAYCICTAAQHSIPRRPAAQ